VASLNVRYRHDVYCARNDCGLLVCSEGDVSEARHHDGSQITRLTFDALRPHVFEISCPAGHMVSVHFPKDVMLLRTPELDAAVKRPPAVLRH
jgi:hypothetical protein